VSKFEQFVVGVAHVAKLLIGLAGMVATTLLNTEVVSVPETWRFPLSMVAIVASAVALYKVPNGPSLSEARVRRLSGGDVE
jgi:hypothetical protein